MRMDEYISRLEAAEKEGRLVWVIDWMGRRPMAGYVEYYREDGTPFVTSTFRQTLFPGESRSENVASTCRVTMGVDCFKTREEADGFLLWRQKAGQCCNACPYDKYSHINLGCCSCEFQSDGYCEKFFERTGFRVKFYGKDAICHLYHEPKTGLDFDLGMKVLRNCVYCTDIGTECQMQLYLAKNKPSYVNQRVEPFSRHIDKLISSPVSATITIENGYYKKYISWHDFVQFSNCIMGAENWEFHEFQKGKKKKENVIYGRCPSLEEMENSVK